MSSILKFYCCGGAGINIGKQFASWTGKDTGLYAQLETVFIDTSKSNLHGGGLNRDQIYLVDELDGSGKLRTTNYGKINESVNEIIHNFKPGNVNVVIHSGGGGSGSVIGPVLVSALLERGEQVVVVVVGSTSSGIETSNTMKTLQGYEAIANKRGRPVNVFYRQNTKDQPRAAVDQQVSTFLTALTMVFSGNIAELDSEDIKNFLDYQRVTGYTPKLSFIDFWCESINIERGESIISVLTVTDTNTDPTVAQTPDYQSVGYLNSEMLATAPKPLPLHLAVIAGHFSGVVSSLKNILNEQDQVRSINHDKTVVDKGANTTDDGLIL